MIDMSSAFHTINHKILLNRLSKSFGLKNNVLNWFNSNLNDKFQSVCMNNLASDLINLSSNVPQGSVSCSTTVYFASEATSSEYKKNIRFAYHFYADDVQFYIAFDHSSNFDKSLKNNCLNAVKQ